MSLPIPPVTVGPGPEPIYSDRFIPSRVGSKLATGLSPAKATSPLPGPTVDEHANETYNLLIRNEIMRENKYAYGGSMAMGQTQTLSSPLATSPNRLFRFKSEAKSKLPDLAINSPVSLESQMLLLSPSSKPCRNIAKQPYKVLDAPALADDFYLNLVDWSSQNVLAVGLASCCYLWSAATAKVIKLCDLDDENDAVTSVCWTQKGAHIAVGTRNGHCLIYDASKCKLLRRMSGHSARVGALSWNGSTLASGSRDNSIFLHDVRKKDHVYCTLVGHKQEVCGLKWSFDETQLASGGNDNKLLIWSAAQTGQSENQPLYRFSDHEAAVKAIAWSPHQSNLLASGGGTADRHIRFWNTATGSALSSHDTGSQVCNLIWSKNSNEIVSTHGYSLNQIIVWKYPSMNKVTTLTGHTYRVLYLGMSPDGQSIVTGAGDETLRFWNIFPSGRPKGATFQSNLSLSSVTEIR